MKNASKVLAAVALFAAACGTNTALEKKGQTENDISGEGDNGNVNNNAFSSMIRRLPPIPAEIQIEPANGATFRNDPNRLQVNFSGFVAKSGGTVEVQVLDTPSSPIADGNWVTIATATVSDTETTFGPDATPFFRWETVASPADGANQNRWPRGGLLRYRTVAVDKAGVKSALPFWDASAGYCVADNQGKSWQDILRICKSPYSPDLGASISNQTKAAALVSTNLNPATDGLPPPYLNRKGEITKDDTDNYYREINAPGTRAEFEQRFGFTGNQGNQRDVESRFYQHGDLGIGREMHCATFGGSDDNLACWVRNYGVDQSQLPKIVPLFNGDENDIAQAIDDMVNLRNSFATVAMVKFGKDYAPARGNDVQFFVYNSQDVLANAAQLDSTGQNQAIPNNCTNCHGGLYDARSRRLVGSSFLPFDPEAFLYSNQRPFRYEDQEDAFREQNMMVARSGAAPSVQQTILGWYGKNGDTPGTSANTDFIPPSWSKTEESKTLYREVYKPYCRTCHVSQSGDFAFESADAFKVAAKKTLDDSCSRSEMPIAEATMGLFWKSGARAYLVNSLGVTDPCAPRGIR